MQCCAGRLQDRSVLGLSWGLGLLLQELLGGISECLWYVLEGPVPACNSQKQHFIKSVSELCQRVAA